MVGQRTTPVTKRRNMGFHLSVVIGESERILPSQIRGPRLVIGSIKLNCDQSLLINSNQRRGIQLSN